MIYWFIGYESFFFNDNNFTTKKTFMVYYLIFHLVYSMIDKNFD